MMFEIISIDELLRQLDNYDHKELHVHHTWKPSHDNFTGSNGLKLQENMRKYHVEHNGWQDIGQHVTLLPDGKFVTGRDFSKAPASIEGHNTGAFACEMLGNFDIGHDILKGEQKASIIALARYFYKNGKYIRFHRENSPKTCPGTSIDKEIFMKEVRNETMGQAKYYKYLPVDLAKLPVLKRGSMGADVKRLQQELNAAGFFCRIVDGAFGLNTDTKVREYQGTCGLKPDGIVGVNTWTKLLTVDVVEILPSMLKAALVSGTGKIVSNVFKSFINGNQYCGKTTIGWLISDGLILSRRDEYKTWKGNPKGTFIVYKDGRVEVGLKYDSDIAPLADAGKIQFCCQNFNLFPVDLKKEGWGENVGRTCNSVMLGYNAKTGKAIIAVRPVTNAARAAKTMEALGCAGAAIRLDSGSPVNMWVDGKALYQTGATLTNIVHW